jgi:imidazolonepropionase-like amidohydrolase
MMRSSGEKKNASMTTPAALHRLKIPFAFQSGFESYVPKTRVVLFEATVAVAYGLKDTHALRHLTLDAARILSIESRVGSIEVGKDGDLALFDGDPFEYTTHVIGTIIDGRHVSEAVR